MFTALLVIDLIAVGYAIYFAISAARKAHKANLMLKEATEHWDNIIILTNHIRLGLENRGDKNG